MTVATQASVGIAVPDVALRRALRRSQRSEQLRAAALVLPLFLFLLAVFIVPIGAMLGRALFDSEVAQILPRVTAALARWDGRELPPDAAYAAVIEDIRAAREAGTLANAATRLNYDVAGFRSLLFATGRHLGDEMAGSPREFLGAIDPRWNERETWAVIRRAAGPVTDFYLLAALDLRRDANDAITGAPPEERVFRNVLGRTLWISGVVTLTCLVLGYPVAYFIARQPPTRAGVLLFLVLLPFWTSLLVRTVAWVVLLQREGILNNLLLSFGLVNEPVRMIFNRFAVYVAMVHVLLPFMVLPLYAVMKGISPSYLRAASSLGAAPLTAFRRVYVPQTLPGVGAGCLMVFIQALGYYITPALVGGADDQMISYFIAFYASKTVNWGMAAALSIMLLAATLALYAVYDRLVGIDKMRLG
ncbi:MAG: ABC transporter permease [Betaproteobacteria bacterium]|jgi:putative spermidine/putrescine transport system permease protein|nr:ABC transporter permease [Betaproteobacteria bacterium]